MNIQEAIKEKTVIHCETESEAKRILKMAHELGYKWWNGKSFTDARNNWYIYEKATCYFIEGGSHSDIKYFTDENYTIINSTDITDMKKENKKMNIQEAIKENTAIHCKTEEEAKRILKMAHELGYNWGSGRSFTDARNSWRVHECETCYDIIDGTCGPVKYLKNRGYKIINSTDITDMKKSTEWTPAPEGLLVMNNELTIMTTTTDTKQELTITPPSGYEIDEEKSTFQKIVFKKIEPKFPAKLEEIDRPWFIDAFGRIIESSEECDQSSNHFTSTESAEKALEFIKLLAFRDAIWAIEGKPENEKIDISFKFKTPEGLEHFEKMKKEIELGNL